MSLISVMEAIQEFVRHNHNFTIGIIIGLILVAGLILRKLRVVAVFLILAASILIYFILHNNIKIEKPDINKIKEMTKAKVMKNIK